MSDLSRVALGLVIQHLDDDEAWAEFKREYGITGPKWRAFKAVQEGTPEGEAILERWVAKKASAVAPPAAKAAKAAKAALERVEQHVSLARDFDESVTAAMAVFGPWVYVWHDEGLCHRWRWNTGAPTAEPEEVIEGFSKSADPHKVRVRIGAAQDSHGVYVLSYDADMTPTNAQRQIRYHWVEGRQYDLVLEVFANTDEPQTPVHTWTHSTITSFGTTQSAVQPIPYAAVVRPLRDGAVVTEIWFDTSRDGRQTMVWRSDGRIDTSPPPIITRLGAEGCDHLYAADILHETTLTLNNVYEVGVDVESNALYALNYKDSTPMRVRDGIVTVLPDPMTDVHGCIPCGPAHAVWCGDHPEVDHKKFVLVDFDTQRQWTLIVPISRGLTSWMGATSWVPIQSLLIIMMHNRDEWQVSVFSVWD